MGYGNGWGMGGGFAGFGIVTWVIVTIDLILLGLWLWKQIKK